MRNELQDVRFKIFEKDKRQKFFRDCDDLENINSFYIYTYQIEVKDGDAKVKRFKITVDDEGKNNLESLREECLEQYLSLLGKPYTEPEVGDCF